MTTITFSSRVNEDDYAYADAITRQEFGMSYEQYCGSILIDAIRQGAILPRPSHASEIQRRKNAINELKEFSARPHNEEIGHMSDEAVNNMIASRYK